MTKQKLLRRDGTLIAEYEGTLLEAVEKNKANLSGANLYGANLDRADLSGANLYGASLSGASLCEANLSGANLYGARLPGALALITSPLYMLRDQPGKIRMYKLVNEHGEGPQYGGIKYEIGKTVEAEADTDETRQCSNGISVASLDWCIKEWKIGYCVLIVEFEAYDIAAIPMGTDGKIRLHRCKVVGEKDISEIIAALQPEKLEGEEVTGKK